MVRERKLGLNDYLIRAVATPLHDVWAIIGPLHGAVDEQRALVLAIEALKGLQSVEGSGCAGRLLQRAYKDHGFSKTISFLRKSIRLI